MRGGAAKQLFFPAFVVLLEEVSEDCYMSRSCRPVSGILAVAKMAGVSPATVSRVVNNTAPVSDEKRELVESAIKELNYEPNNMARTLIVKRSNIIGVIIDRSIRYATANVLVQLEERAAACGYVSMVLTISKPFRSSLKKIIARFLSLSVDGMIVIAPRIGLSEEIVRIKSDVPLVIISNELQDIGIPMVGEDQEYGASILTEHLVRMGHRRIWHVSGSLEWYDEIQRRKGWMSVLRKHGLEHCSKIIETGGWSADRAFELSKTLPLSTVPDAIFAASDHMAMAVISALSCRGVRVPKEVSVVGYDDAYGTAYVTPSLTTVRQDLPSVARRAVELLIRLIDGEEIPMVTSMKPVLVSRSSVEDRR